MTGQRASWITGLGLLLGAVSGAAQEPAPMLTTNPFDRPGFVVNQIEPGARNLPVRPVELELRTTMVGGSEALANINGEILTVGDTYEGYRVASIREGRVVLTKDGERMELDIYAIQRGANEGRNELER